MAGRARDRLLMTALVAVLASVIGALGYSVWQTTGNSTTAPPIAPDPTVAATGTADPTQEAQAKAIAAYVGYREAYVSAAAKPDAAHPDIAKYVADPLLTEVRIAIDQAVDLGIVYKGRPTWTPRVTAVNLTRQPYSATVEDCFDSTAWEPVYSKTGKSAAAPGQANRYVITSTAKLFSDKGWLLTESKADRSRAC